MIVGLLNVSCAQAGKCLNLLLFSAKCSQAKDLISRTAFPTILPQWTLHITFMYLFEYWILQVLQPVPYVGAELSPSAKVAHWTSRLYLNLLSRQH
jgi:hypothetical protein